MPDYYALMARAVAKLDRNTAEDRRVLFDRARALVVHQLRRHQPGAAEPEIKRELFALEEAIRKVELELAIALVRSTKSAADLPPSGRVFVRSPIVSGLTSDDLRDIERFKSEQPSILIHLTAHLWLERLITDAKIPSLSESVQQDVDTVLKWLEVKKPEDIGTKQHEQWERGFRQYLTEGKAPSSSLARSFNFFRDQLQGPEQTPDNLGKPITDDVRAVYDHLLASHQEADKNPARVSAQLRGALGFIVAFLLMFGLETLLFGGLQFLSGQRARLIGLGWLVMPIAAGCGAWILLRRVEFAKVGLKSLFVKFKSWPRDHKIALGLSFAIGWIVAIVLGFFASIAGRPDYSPPTFGMWLLGSSEYFPWASLASGMAGGMVGAAIICVRQLLRSGDATASVNMINSNDAPTMWEFGANQTNGAWQQRGESA